jgi:hypothetical protein
MKQLKVYVASSWRNRYQQDVVGYLRAIGQSVYDFRNPDEASGFSWAEIDENWEEWSTEEYKLALENEKAVSGFMNDYNAMVLADICVLVCPCGRSAHSEAGFFSGANKEVFVYMPEVQEPELMYKMFGRISQNMRELLGHITEFIDNQEGRTSVTTY